MGANDGAVEHSNQMSAFIKSSQNGKIVFENTRLTQAVKTFPYAVPVTKLLRQSPPGDVVKGEIMLCLKETGGHFLLSRQRMVGKFEKPPVPVHNHSLSFWCTLQTSKSRQQYLNNVERKAGTGKLIPESIRPHGLSS